VKTKLYIDDLLFNCTFTTVLLQNPMVRSITVFNESYCSIFTVFSSKIQKHFYIAHTNGWKSNLSLIYFYFFSPSAMYNPLGFQLLWIGL